MEGRECGGFQHNGGVRQASAVQESGTQTGNHTVTGPQVRRFPPRPVQYQQLMFQEHGLGDHRPNTAWLHQTDDRDDQVREEDEDIAHRGYIESHSAHLTSL